MKILRCLNTIRLRRSIDTDESWSRITIESFRTVSVFERQLNIKLCNLQLHTLFFIVSHFSYFIILFLGGGDVIETSGGHETFNFGVVG